MLHTHLPSYIFVKMEARLSQPCVVPPCDEDETIVKRTRSSSELINIVQTGHHTASMERVWCNRTQGRGSCALHTHQISWGALKFRMEPQAHDSHSPSMEQKALDCFLPQQRVNSALRPVCRTHWDKAGIDRCSTGWLQEGQMLQKQACCSP